MLIDQVLKVKIGMSLNKAEIDKCHRVGKLTTRSRPLLVKFVRLSVRDDVLKNGYRLKNTDIWVSEDVPVDVKNKKADVRWVANYAIKQGHRAKIILHGEACVIDGTRYTYDTLATLPKGLSLSESKSVRLSR